MRIIIFQGMACLGKTTLCNALARELPNCNIFSLDKYKEDMWDKFGFSSWKQREHQSFLAKELFYSDIDDAVREHKYDYIFLDYAFTEKYWNELQQNLDRWEIPIRTIYMQPVNLKDHEEAWQKRSRDFKVRHPGHGATQYHDGIGSGYINMYSCKVFSIMPVTPLTLGVFVSFKPYKLNVSYTDILKFITQ